MSANVWQHPDDPLNRAGTCCYCGVELKAYEAKMNEVDGDRIACIEHSLELKIRDGVSSWRVWYYGL